MTAYKLTIQKANKEQLTRYFRNRKDALGYLATYKDLCDTTDEGKGIKYSIENITIF